MRARRLRRLHGAGSTACAVRSCLLLAVQADGCEVETVESLAGRRPATPLQDAFRRHHALQCGFCTPGILMAADGAARARSPAVARRDRRPALRAPLPLHRLRADRRRDRRSWSARSSDSREPRASRSRRLRAASERRRSRRSPTRAAPACRPAGRRPRRRARRARGSPSSRTGSRPSSSSGPASGWAPSSCRSPGGSRRRTSTTASRTPARCSSRPRTTASPGGAASTPGALELDERETSIMLYTSGTTGRPKGVPRSHRAERAGGCRRRPPRLSLRRAHARRDAALPHDGRPLADRDVARRRLLRAAGATGRRPRRSG